MKYMKIDRLQVFIAESREEMGGFLAMMLRR